MKLLDRYVLKSFAASLLVALVFFEGMFLLIHFFNRMTGLSTAATSLHAAGYSTIGGFARYYGLFTPFILVETAPFAVVMAAMWALQQMAQRNELVPVVTSGVSYRRLTVPIFLVAALVGLGFGAAREGILPKLQFELDRMERLLRGRDEAVLEDVRLLRDGNGYVVSVAEYSMNSRIAKHIDITNPADDRGRYVYAAAAEWRETPEPGWYPVPGSKTRGYQRGPLPTDITARDIEVEGKSLVHMGADELSELIAKNPHRPKLRVLFQLHFAYPFYGLVLLLIGLPLIFAGRSSSPYIAAGTSLFVSMAFFATQKILQDIGTRGDLPPIAAAWLPVALFGAAGILIFETRT